MTAPVPPPESESGTNVLTRDPVRIVWVCYAFVQGVVIALMAAQVVTERLSAVITGVALAAYVAVSELFVRPETVPREPLADLARAEAAEHPST